VNSVITITGIGDHLQPEWLITFTGIRKWLLWRSAAILILRSCVGGRGANMTVGSAPD
jgi:hypothetical protein